jgi:hypothetical protein
MAVCLCTWSARLGVVQKHGEVLLSRALVRYTNQQDRAGMHSARKPWVPAIRRFDVAQAPRKSEIR